MSDKQLPESILAISAIAIATHTQPHLEPSMAPHEHIEVETAVHAVRPMAPGVEQRGGGRSVALTGQELQVASGLLGVSELLSL